MSFISIISKSRKSKHLWRVGGTMFFELGWYTGWGLDGTYWGMKLKRLAERDHRGPVYAFRMFFLVILEWERQKQISVEASARR